MKKRTKLINWLYVFLWLGVIYFFSSQPNLKSDLQPLWDLILRKIAHISEYFVLSFLLFRAFSAHNLKFRKALTLAFILALFYAFTDEYHQSFTPGRTASLIDVGIDSLGAVAFCVLKVREAGK